MSGPTLIVETGLNVPNANTYISQADAVTYFTNTGNEPFLNASDADQATALVRACYGMNSWLNGRWYGIKTNSQYANPDGSASTPQSLDWPRCGVQDSDGYWIPNNIVPQKVKFAQAEIAAIELTTPFIQQKVDKYDNPASEGVGPVSISFKPTAPSITYWPQIIAMLKDFALIGVMPIEVVVGTTQRERIENCQNRSGAVYGGAMNPFDFPNYFQLVKYGSSGCYPDGYPYGNNYGSFF